MDNQQAISEFDLGWLVGVFDSEGFVTIVMGRGCNTSNAQLIPRIGMGMTHKESVERVAGLLTKLDIPFYIHSYEATTGRKAIHYITMSGFQRAKRFLEKVGSRLRTKADQAKLVSGYIERRSSKRHNEPYTTQDWDDFDNLGKMNRGIRRESSEAIRQAGRKRAEDMVHPN